MPATTPAVATTSVRPPTAPGITTPSVYRGGSAPMIATATKPEITLSATDVRMLEVSTALAIAAPAATSAPVITSDGCPVLPPNTYSAMTAPTAPVATPTTTHSRKYVTPVRPRPRRRTP